MTFANLLVDPGPPVALVTVNRPHVLNALDAATIDELARAFRALGDGAGVRAALLTGAGAKAFVAGADIAVMATMSPDEARAFAEAGQRLCTLVEELPFPVVAAVNGFALGGGLELALACDFILASSNAKLGLPEVGLGVTPGFGGTQRLPRRVGLPRAREMVYTGRPLDADQAVRVGLVNEVTEPAALLPRARALGEAIAARAPLAVAAAKRALRDGMDRPLAQGLALERELFAALFASADQKAGMRAFLEKRSPEFEGR